MALQFTPDETGNWLKSAFGLKESLKFLEYCQTF